MFEDLVASVFLLLTTTDVVSIGDGIRGVDDTVVVAVTVVSDWDPHITLKFPSIPPLRPITEEYLIVSLVKRSSGYRTCNNLFVLLFQNNIDTTSKFRCDYLKKKCCL